MRAGFGLAATGDGDGGAKRTVRKGTRAGADRDPGRGPARFGPAGAVGGVSGAGSPGVSGRCSPWEPGRRGPGRLCVSVEPPGLRLASVARPGLGGGGVWMRGSLCRMHVQAPPPPPAPALCSRCRPAVRRRVALSPARRGSQGQRSEELLVFRARRRTFALQASQSGRAGGRAGDRPFAPLRPLLPRRRAGLSPVPLPRRPVWNSPACLQVCEVYKLHRETFYLAQDFFDRYMATQHDIVKTLLQLVGISSLFIAAKLEVRAAGGRRSVPDALPAFLALEAC